MPDFFRMPCCSLRSSLFSCANWARFGVCRSFDFFGDMSHTTKGEDQKWTSSIEKAKGENANEKVREEWEWSYYYLIYAQLAVEMCAFNRFVSHQFSLWNVVHTACISLGKFALLLTPVAVYEQGSRCVAYRFIGLPSEPFIVIIINIIFGSMTPL